MGRAQAPEPLRSEDSGQRSQMKRTSSNEPRVGVRSGHRKIARIQWKSPCADVLCYITSTSCSAIFMCSMPGIWLSRSIRQPLLGLGKRSYGCRHPTRRTSIYRAGDATQPATGTTGTDVAGCQSCHMMAVRAPNRASHEVQVCAEGCMTAVQRMESCPGDPFVDGVGEEGLRTSAGCTALQILLAMAALPAALKRIQARASEPAGVSSGSKSRIAELDAFRRAIRTCHAAPVMLRALL